MENPLYTGAGDAFAREPRGDNLGRDGTGALRIDARKWLRAYVERDRDRVNARSRLRV